MKRAAILAALLASAAPAHAVDSRIFTHAGHAAIYREMAAGFLGAAAGAEEIVAFAYREHPKIASPGPSDICRTGGIAWGGDVAQDAIYITSSLRQPATLEVIGVGPTVTVALPADQAKSGQQAVVPVAAAGTPTFRLSRDGAVVHEWAGKLAITATPAIRTVSTYSDVEAITGEADDPRVWFEAIATDKQEGAAGAQTPFTIRMRRNVSGDTLTAQCRVIAGSATASDFVGGVLPASPLTASPGALFADWTVFAAGDGTQEGDETFTFSCTDFLPSSYAAPADARISAIIRNDDAGVGAPKWSIRAIDPSVLEGTGAGSTPQAFEILRTGDIAGRTDTIDFCPAPSEDGSPSASPADFVGGWGTQIVTAGPGVTSQIVSKNIAKDDIPEPTESYVARLRYPSSGTLVESGVAVASIVDDDLPASPSRVNAGADEPVSDSAGNLWSPDIGVGGAVDTNAFDFAGTLDDVLYRTNRYGASTYAFDVAPGAYTVKGLFAEHDAANNVVNCGSGPGRRLMQATVTAQGGDVITSPVVDPLCAAGFRAAHVADLATINAPQGKLSVAIRGAAASQSSPLVNGLYLVPYAEPPVPRSADWIDLGAPAAATYTDAAGNTWRGMPPTLASGCLSVVDGARPPISGTADDHLYWSTCRGSDMSFTVPITGGGDRMVTMLFAEPTAGPGARAADVYVNGVKQISALDVASEAGAINTALIKVVGPTTVSPSGTVSVRVVSTTGASAIIAGIAVTEALGDAEYSARIGWKGRRFIDKTALIRAVSPTGLSQSGRPLVVRRLNTTNSTLYACHGACSGVSTRGLQPDTEAANNASRIEMMAHEPGDEETSLFPALGVGASVEETFTVSIAELLPGGTLGNESVVTVSVLVSRAK